MFSKLLSRGIFYLICQNVFIPKVVPSYLAKLFIPKLIPRIRALDAVPRATLGLQNVVELVVQTFLGCLDRMGS